MFSFSVNGKTVSTDKDKSLLRFLRDDLHLAGAKDGCSEGVCGACTVIIDGKATKACVAKTSRLQDKEVITIEGLTEDEKQLYSYCFAKAGAVQCGFCTPGMIMSTKALLDKNNNPTEEEVKKALRGNICRCTGYVKIEQAVLLAAELIRNKERREISYNDASLGSDFIRIDAVPKALGTGVFADDIQKPGMLYARALRSPYPRAKLVNLNFEKAKEHPGFVRALTAEDVPHLKIGKISRDWDVMIAKGHHTHYVGDTVALIVATDYEAATEILDLVEATYEEKTPVLSVQEAKRKNAPLVHKGRGNLLGRVVMKRGNAEEAIKNSPYVVRREYHTPMTEHAFMEPECAVAEPMEENGVVVYTASQSVYDEQEEIALLLKIPKEKVRCISQFVGGGFGGKEDMSVQHHAALAAWILKKPVKVRLTREESLRVHPKRHAMDMVFTTSCDERGRLTGLKAEILTDNGAYASLGMPVLQRACTHAGGPYNFNNIEVTGEAWYTNNIPAGAFRGFGVTQSCFAMENNINILAKEVGIDPWQMRFLNAIKPGDVLPNGQIATKDTAMQQCLLAVKKTYEENPGSGIACSMKNSGIGVGAPDAGRCCLKVENQKIHILSSAACMGQGFATVALQIAACTTALDPSLFIVQSPDTALTPNSGTSTASRQTAISGEAVRKASEKLKLALSNGHTLQELEGKEFFSEFTAETDPFGSHKENPVSHLAYSYSAQVVTLDSEGRVKKVTAACDSGTIINNIAFTGQVEGGVLMGLGYAFTEDFPVKDGLPQLKYGNLGLIRTTEAPKIEVISSPATEKSSTSFGAKGIGELCTIATAPACWHAYYLKDGKERNNLPMEDTTYRKTKN